MPISEHIKKLFAIAKKQDEFEFICTLLNYKGLGTRKSNSNLHEWFDSISFYKKLYLETKTLEEKTRIGLLIYSTFFESSDLYNIIGSLARITMGYRSSPYLYFKHASADRWFGTGEKVSMIEEVLTDAGFGEIQLFFEEVHIKQLRNAFFHSSYSIEDGEFILHEADYVIVNGVGVKTLNIEEFIVPKIGKVIDFFDEFKGLYFSYSNSYTENKIVKGRFDEWQDIKILGSEKGLLGFEAQGSYIKYDEHDFLSGMNIRFNFPSEVDRYIQEEIERYFKKTTINKNDGALQRLYEVITERNKPLEKKNLAIVYNRLAEIIFENGRKEVNHFKQKAYFKQSLDFFSKMKELDPTLKVNYNMAIAKYMVSDGDMEMTKESLNDMIDCLNLKIESQILKSTMHIISSLKKEKVNIENETTTLKDLLTKNSIEELKEEIENAIKELAKS